jgi:2-polyprenyl-6-methoxyphenol hydroxylase-like FAD-dependent oxidoreductase
MFIGRRAVVIGAGVGGLAAAQALSGKFEKIVVLERDVLPAQPEARMGVPQGRHAHALLPGGAAALDTLFGGCSAKLIEAGAKHSDFGTHFVYEVGGQPMPERSIGTQLIKCSRPLIEAVVRSFVQQRNDIAILDGRRVTGIVAAADGRAVSAVICEARDGMPERYEADLVVDASGRGELTLAFLAATGRPAPEETTIGIDVAYSTAIVEFPAGAMPDFHVMLTMPKAPDNPRGGMILVREDNSFFASLSSRGGDAPPADWPSFIEYATRLTTRTHHDLMKRAKLRGRIMQFKFAESRRVHFEKLADWPRGLVPLGDALCRFNPVYGQGMSSAALQAVLLRDLLAARRGGAQPLDGLFGAFAAAIAPTLDNIWSLSALPDLAYAHARGARPDGLQQTLDWNVAVHQAAFADVEVQRRLFEVIGLLKPASALREPAFVDKVERLVAQMRAEAEEDVPVRA